MAALTRLYHAGRRKTYFGWVHDVSAGGAAFELRTALAPGDILVCRLRGVQPEEDYQVEAEVIHTRPADGLHRVGCRFLVPLPADQLRTVLLRLRGEVGVA